ncbi:MAG TPA: hypothetical protein VFR63_04860 [Gaiellaceae bacterium]|nr:hypothetical protein [Gaiellaceae bacterium]
MIGTRGALLALLAAVALSVAPAAAADLADETELAERYAPVVRLVEQEEECGPGEPYEPLDVDVLFDEPTVSLRGPWNAADLVDIAPAGDDLAEGLYEYHLDFPGNALDPGCGYERWARRLTEDTEPTVYAHVATDPGHPGRLALQYWLFYAFNDWNNLHEGDWEMIQLVFEAPDPREALSRRPTSVGYSQHEGAERAEWGDEKLELVDGTHPVVHPAAGSHANFYEEALYLGTSADEGVGCDDTTEPTIDLRPVVRTIPSDPEEARRAFPWIAFEGRWGELQRAFFNGPTGPNLKSQWTEPIAWSEEWRSRSYAVPAGSAFGTETTDFFCDAVAGGSEAVRKFVEDPLPVVLVLAALLALLVLGISRATWTPTTPLRLARRRAWGQIVASAGRMYLRRFPLFVGIAALLVPITVLVSLLQAVVLGASRVAGIDTDGESGGLLVLLVVAVGTTLTLLGVGVVQAATVRALVEIDEGRPIGPLGAYRLVLDSILPLLGAIALAVVVVSLLASSVFLLPIAVWLAVRWALVVPVVELEGLFSLEALRRSGRLVRREWLKVASLTVVGAGLALLAGPLAGALLLLLTGAPLWVVNLVAGIVYAIVIPFVALATAFVYFDARVSDELAPERERGELPAEIELST